MKYTESDYYADAAFDRAQKRKISDFQKKTGTDSGTKTMGTNIARKNEKSSAKAINLVDFFSAVTVFTSYFAEKRVADLLFRKRGCIV